MELGYPEMRLEQYLAEIAKSKGLMLTCRSREKRFEFVMPKRRHPKLPKVGSVDASARQSLEDLMQKADKLITDSKTHEMMHRRKFQK